MKRSIMLSAMLALTAAAFAGEHSPKKAASKEFEMLKQLAGDWKGEADMMGKKEACTTTFKVSSGGSAIIETMGAGTPHEMTNVYHDVDGKLYGHALLRLRQCSADDAD